jgi:hypothetical protein
MLLDGMLGTVCSSFGLLEAAAGEAWLSVVPVAGRRGLFGTDLSAASILMLGSGGGKGEIEMAVTEAEWAW